MLGHGWLSGRYDISPPSKTHSSCTHWSSFPKGTGVSDPAQREPHPFRGILCVGWGNDEISLKSMLRDCCSAVDYLVSWRDGHKNWCHLSSHRYIYIYIVKYSRFTTFNTVATRLLALCILWRFVSGASGVRKWMVEWLHWLVEVYLVNPC